MHEEGGEVVYISEPRILRYERKAPLVLTGKTAVLALSGSVLSSFYQEAIPSPYFDSLSFSEEKQFAVYSPRAPTKY